jgi:hypothetical protein
MGDGILDFEGKPIDVMSAIYEDEPNTTMLTGLLNAIGYENEQSYSQPWFFGEDSVANMGKSHNYPQLRTYEDEKRFKQLMPLKEDYIIEPGYVKTGPKSWDVVWNEGGFDELAYDHAKMKAIEEYANRDRVPYQEHYGVYK